MRQAFSTELVEYARNNRKVVLLTGDHGYALFDEFRRVCPAQYINAGVAEQNMIGVAAGLAKGGYRPVVYGLSSFVPIRVLEQIKLDLCHEKLPVTLIGDGAGMVYSTLGSSHQSAEDISAVRALPHLSILSPADAHEMRACMKLAMTSPLPVYLRMGKSDLGDVHDSLRTYEWGEIRRVKAGTGDIAFIATGSMVRTALEITRLRWQDGEVWSAPSLKPIDVANLIQVLQQHRVIVVMEEHSIFGGLGSIVSEIAGSHCPRWICRIGVQDRFSERCGSYPYLMQEHQLTADACTNQILDFLAKI